MSFLKITDPLKRDAIVKEYLELKKKIKSNFLSERIGEQQLQTDLSKFYKPITETQKATAREITEGLKPITETQRATAREITEGLKPIREGIEKLPEAIQKTKEDEEEEEDEEEDFDEDREDKESVGDLAYVFLIRPNIDTNFGIYKEGDHHFIGDRYVIIKDNNIIFPNDETIKPTRGLWELITSKNPKNYTDEDYDKYKYLMLKTNAIHKGNNEYNIRAKGNYRGAKWKNIISPIWKEIMKNMGEEYKGKGVVVIPSDPNALLERLDLLLASQKAGHTGVRNELVSICDELKRQGVLDTKGYKNLNHLIKK